MEILGAALEMNLQPMHTLSLALQDIPEVNFSLQPGGVVIIPTAECPVISVNQKTGSVELDASDVGALPDDTEIPAKVSELANDSGFVSAKTAPGKRNYVDTIDPLGGSYYRSNAARDGNKLRLTYQDASRNTYFYIFLAKPLNTGKAYTLSFDCSGVSTGQVLRFRVARFSNVPDATIYDEGAAISDPFVLRNGKNAVTFTLSSPLNSMVRIDDVLGTGETRPTGANIVLENFQIEDGDIATEWHPSLDAAHNAAERIETLTRAMTEKEGWDVALVDEDFVTASIILDKSLAFSVDSASGLYASSWRYYPLPFPLLGAPFTGSCDKLGCYVGNRNGSFAVHGKDAKGNDRNVSVGIYYKIFAPGATAAFTETIYYALQVAARRAAPPEDPGTAFETPDAEIGAAIIAVAESYVTAVTGGRKIVYGRNFLNSESSSAVNDEDGNGLMECDTFVGLVLRGVEYTDSPYADTTANKTQDYSTFMSNTASGLPTWATNLRAKISASATAQNYFKHDFKTAAEFAWMFWKISGCLFTDASKAAPGDVAFFRDPQTSPWFDGITHVAIVGEPDASGMTIYEVTGQAGESAGKFLQHVSLANRSSKPAYFARPYGWT